MTDAKAFVVTGSSSGVGAAVALALARLGFGVVINYSKSAAAAEETAQACLDAGGDALVVRADVADDAGPLRLDARPRGALGRRLPADLRGQPGRGLPDDPGLRSAAARRPGLRRQRLVDRGQHGRGLVGRVC